MSDFIHLHVHSEYSLLDGACRIKDLVERARELNMPALALTDHGNLFGAIEFHKEASKAGIKPIIGCEVYIAPGSMKERKTPAGKEPAYHFLLLAASEAGYRNLIKLVSSAHLDGHYYKPRIDREILAAHSQGLIGTSACLKGEIPQAILKGRMDEAESLIGVYREILGPENFFLEVQDHGIEDQARVREALRVLSAKTGAPLLATNDVHYVRKEHARAHDILLCIQTGAKMADEKRLRYASQEFYMKTRFEMEVLFSDMPEALANTRAIAERCEVNIEFGKIRYPAYKPPDGLSGVQFLRRLCEEGATRRYGSAVEEPSIRDRMETELRVIEEMGFVDYFLIVWDFIHFAKTRGIPVGPGRGSAAGSIAAYVLEITDLDPIRYGLIFERFLNPERVSPPDIDVDFCQTRRGEVIQYVRDKYGDRSVAQIVTYGTLGAKMAVRDVARVMGLSFTEASRIADLIPKDPKITIDRALEASVELQTLRREDAQAREVIDTARELEGMVRQTGTHAAGVVIADGDLTDRIPLTKDDHGNIMTQYSMDALGDLGMLKMDFLGLKTLTVIEDCLRFIEKSTGKKITIDQIPLDDTKTFELLNRAQNIGVFQVESPGMRRTCLDFNIQSLEDIIALLALYRPGPKELIPEYIQRKKGLVSFQYHHPLLEEVSAETYGVLIYQEQVMKAAQVLAGYSMGGADLLRRAMSKKKKEEMDKQRAIFIKGAEEHNRIPQRQAEDIFGLLQKFADYGFNKSHSAAYGLVAYQTAYLKANYPVEFMAALLSNELDNTDKIALFVDEVQSLGIQVLPPSVNESALSFSVAPNAIRYGLAAIKNVGESAAGAIVRARESNGPFTSLEDFCRRVDYRSINKRSVESLIKSGAFDCISDNRAGLFARIDKALAAAQSIARDAEMGQTTLFMDDALFSPPAETQDAALADWPRLEKLAFEKELLGFYVTGHPIDDFEAELRSFRTTRLGELSDEEDRTAVRLAGMIVSKEVLIGKKDKRPWARIALEDRGGRGEIVVWSSTYEQTAGMLNIGAPLIVEGTIDRSQEAFPKVIANNAMDIDTACRQLVTGVHVRATRQGLEQDFCRRLLAIAKANRGDRILCVEAPGEKGGLAFIETSQDYYISCDRKILSALREAFGPKSVRCRVLPVNVQPPKRWDRNKSGNSNRKSQRDVSKKLAS